MPKTNPLRMLKTCFCSLAMPIFRATAESWCSSEGFRSLIESKCFPLRDGLARSSVRVGELLDWLSGGVDMFALLG